MAKGPRYRVSFRRRREGRTDYRRRLGLLKGSRPRAVVRKTQASTIVQFIRSDRTGDKVLASAVAKELREYGWKGPSGNLVAAYLTGYLAGRRAVTAGVTEALLDIGLHPPSVGSRVFAALKGALDAGVTIPHDEAVLPGDSRLQGDHLGVKVETPVATIREAMEART